MKTVYFLQFVSACLLASCSKQVEESGNHHYNPYIPDADVVYEKDSIIPDNDDKLKYAPIESKHREKFVSNPTPPTGFSAIIGWAQALDMPLLGSTVPSEIEIDYIRIYGMYNGTKKLIIGEEYDIFKSYNGALRSRSNKAFCGLIGEENLPGKTENGIMVLDISAAKDRLWHWWTERPPMASLPDYAIIESKIRLTGNACFQLGGDWYLNDTVYPQWDVTVKEIGGTDWYGPSNDWQVVTFFSLK